MLSVVHEACHAAPDLSHGVIVVQSDIDGPPFTEAFHELDSQDARALAQRHAAMIGIVSARINGNVTSPYAVNSEGISLEFVRDDRGRPLPPAHPRMQPFKYRIDVPVRQPMR